jgi:hypothetical protein
MLKVMLKGVWLALFYPDHFDVYEEKVKQVRKQLAALRTERDELHTQMKHTSDPILLRYLRNRCMEIKQAGRQAWEQL